MIERCRGYIGLDPELKEDGLAAEVHDLDASVRTGLLAARGVSADPGPAGDILAAAAACGASCVIPDALDHELIKLATDASTGLVIWNANFGDEISAALHRPGVLGVITDSPQLMRDALRAAGPVARLPAYRFGSSV